MSATFQSKPEPTRTNVTLPWRVATVTAPTLPSLRVARIWLPVERGSLVKTSVGSLNEVEFRKDPNFGFEVPVAVPGVDSGILDPRSTWADKDAYDRTAANLVDLFVENFAQFEAHVDEGVRQAAPKVATPA